MIVNCFFAIFFVVLIFLGISLLFATFAKPFEKEDIISLSKLVSDIEAGSVQKVSVTAGELSIIYKEGGIEKISNKEEDAALSETLLNLGLTREALAQVEIETKKETGLLVWLLPLSAILLPLLFFVLIFFFIFRQAKGGLGQAFDFTKAKARLFGAEGTSKERITFKDVAGLKEAKEELLARLEKLFAEKKELQDALTTDNTEDIKKKKPKKKESKKSSDVSIYIHIPYCDSLCYFCGCTTFFPSFSQTRKKKLSGLCLKPLRTIVSEGPTGSPF